jgi:TRAP-type C4-dicarboxylate transport system permease small subunit
MAITWIAASALGLMVLVIFINVIGRYLFRMPLKGTVEIVELALVVTVFFAMAYTEVVQGHITMDEVVARFPRRARSIVLSTMYFAAAAFFFTIGYGDTVLAVSFLRPIVRVTDILHIPIAPLIFVIAVGSVIFGLELLMNGLFPTSTTEEEEGT